MSTAESLRAEILTKAEAEAAQIVERAHTEVRAERDRALQELRTQVGAMSVELAARIVERELDGDTHQHLVDEYIERLSSTS
jgi:F-type H+-transporting ATPase subunit b